MKKTMLIALVIVVAFTVITCDDGKDTHTHDWGNWVETTSPTITTDGVETRTCATCNATETRTGTAALATPFFGTWNEDPIFRVLTISSVSFRLDADSVPFFSTIDNPDWEATENENDLTKDEYPSGYTLNGTYTTSSHAEIVGNPVSMTIFINAEKNKLVLSDNVTPFIKQQEN